MTFISWSSDFVISPRLFDAWVSYFQIMRQCDPNFDLKVNISHCGLCFMVKWFAQYLQDYLMDEHHSWYNGSVWHIDWPYQVHVGQWPIFYGPVILLHILRTIWWRNVVLGIMDQCDFKDWPCKIYVGQWSIFHGPLILPYIIVIDLNYFYTLRNGTSQGYSCPSKHLL